MTRFSQQITQKYSIASVAISPVGKKQNLKAKETSAEVEIFATSLVLYASYQRIQRYIIFKTILLYLHTLARVA